MWKDDANFLDVDIQRIASIASRLTNRKNFSGSLVDGGSDKIWRRGIRPDEKEAVLREAHYGTTGAHYAGDVTTRKVLQAGLWWLTTQKDAYEYCKQCDLCQRTGQPTEKDRMPHHLVLPLEPF